MSRVRLAAVVGVIVAGLGMITLSVIPITPEPVNRLHDKRRR